MAAHAVPTIKVTPEFEGVAIHINGTLHLWLDRTKLLGISSWIKTGRRQFFIEFVMVGGTITTDYDNRDKWSAILGGLEKALFVGES